MSDDGLVSFDFNIGGSPYQELLLGIKAAEAAAAALVVKRNLESDGRRRERENGDGEHRRGSKHRRSYTAKDKVALLELYDDNLDNPLILKKIDGWEQHSQSKGVPYTTVVKWAKPTERARIYKASSKMYAASLLRIDKASRKVGKYPDMEKAVFGKMKVRRAKNRKVSARWLSATAKKCMHTMHPGVAFKGGYHWRRRYAKRFNLAIRRKTNCKGKS